MIWAGVQPYQAEDSSAQYIPKVRIGTTTGVEAKQSRLGGLKSAQGIGYKYIYIRTKASICGEVLRGYMENVRN